MVGGQSLLGGFLTPSESFISVNLQGGLLMSIELFLAVASFAVSVFALGYMLGIAHKNQK
jgi:hypothetical protein